MSKVLWWRSETLFAIVESRDIFVSNLTVSQQKLQPKYTINECYVILGGTYYIFNMISLLVGGYCVKLDCFATELLINHGINGWVNMYRLGLWKYMFECDITLHWCSTTLLFPYNIRCTSCYDTLCRLLEQKIGIYFRTYYLIFDGLVMMDFRNNLFLSLRPASHG